MRTKFNQIIRNGFRIQLQNTLLGLTFKINISYFCKKKMSKTKISIVPTSNEAILKFEADRFLTNHNSFEFNNIDDAKHSPLAQQLFYLPFVKKQNESCHVGKDAMPQLLIMRQISYSTASGAGKDQTRHISDSDSAQQR